MVVIRGTQLNASEVASSSLAEIRYSIKCRCGGIGRRKGLKIPRSCIMWVQIPSPVV